MKKELCSKNEIIRNDIWKNECEIFSNEDKENVKHRRNNNNGSIKW